MRLKKQEVKPNYNDIRDEYIKWSQSHELPSSEDNIDDQARRRVMVKKNITEEQFNSAIFEDYIVEDKLEEDTLEQAAENELNAEVAYRGTLEQELDKALKFNKREHRLGGRDFLNILFIGEAGSGKTSRINKWAEENNINLVIVRGADLDASDFGGALVPDAEKKYARKLGSTEFDNLDYPDSVLFLDEYNRAPKSVRSSLMELVNSHIIYDPQEKKQQKYFPNFLFTVAAINPSTMNYDTDTMDMAERSRFAKKYLDSDAKATLQYLTNRYTNAIENARSEEEKLEDEGRLKLAKTLLTSADFTFDTAVDIDKISETDDFESLLSARTLTMTLNDCDGTKEDFLREWDNNINRAKKPMAERILKNYVDVDDKANDALKRETESDVFKKEDSNLDKIKNVLGI